MRMTMADKKKVFSKYYNGQANFMTPDVITIFGDDHLLIELSSGYFIDHELYGVTVLENKGEGWKARNDLSTSTRDVEEAKKYARDLLWEASRHRSDRKE